MRSKASKQYAVCYRVVKIKNLPLEQQLAGLPSVRMLYHRLDNKTIIIEKHRGRKIIQIGIIDMQFTG